MINFNEEEEREVIACKADSCFNDFIPTRSTSAYCSRECYREQSAMKTKMRQRVQYLGKAEPPSVDYNKNHFTDSACDLLRRYGLTTTTKERNSGLVGRVKADVLEAVNARVSIFTEEEYQEELVAISDRHNLKLTMIEDCANNMSVDKLEFSYGNLVPGETDVLDLPGRPVNIAQLV